MIPLLTPWMKVMKDVLKMSNVHTKHHQTAEKKKENQDTMIGLAIIAHILTYITFLKFQHLS